MYSSRVGWHAIRWLCRTVNINPFRREGQEPEHFEQILAVCR
jgi:hypothetical protein